MIIMKLSKPITYFIEQAGKGSRRRHLGTNRLKNMLKTQKKLIWSLKGSLLPKNKSKT